MFDLELRRKRRRLDTVESHYHRVRERAEERGLTGPELRDEVAPQSSEVLRASEDYYAARSRRIIQQARRLEIPVPEISDGDGNWERGRTFEGRFLTDQGVSQLRAAIRAEQREHYESWSRWVVLAIGLLGAVTGLVAVLATAF